MKKLFDIIKNFRVSTYSVISFKVTLLFSAAIASSFFGDYLHEFFGDTYCTAVQSCGEFRNHRIPTYHWGTRHWLYMWLCLSLFSIQAASIINYIKGNRIVIDTRA